MHMAALELHTIMHEISHANARILRAGRGGGGPKVCSGDGREERGGGAASELWWCEGKDDAGNAACEALRREVLRREIMCWGGRREWRGGGGST